MMIIKESRPNLQDWLKNDKIRYVHLKSNSLYLINELSKICDNLYVHDLRTLSLGWREQAKFFNQLSARLSLARHYNEKHIIVSNTELPITIQRMFGMVISHKDGFVTFNWWLLDRYGNRIY